VLQSTGLNERFYLSGNQLRAAHNSSAISAAWPSDGAWHHAAVTFDTDGNEAALYIDGIKVSDGTLTSRTAAVQSALSGFNGLVDDVRVWKRALSATEVRAIYLGSKAAPS
jgi:hypothetical protein